METFPWKFQYETVTTRRSASGTGHPACQLFARRCARVPRSIAVTLPTKRAGSATEGVGVGTSSMGVLGDGDGGIMGSAIGCGGASPPIGARQAVDSNDATTTAPGPTASSEVPTAAIQGGTASTLRSGTTPG